MITLTAKTKKGRDRISKWGSSWEILEEMGSRFLIVSLSDNSCFKRIVGLPNSARWVEKQDDPDFEITQTK